MRELNFPTIAFFAESMIEVALVRRVVKAPITRSRSWPIRSTT